MNSNQKGGQLTPQQNEAITEVLCAIARNFGTSGPWVDVPEELATIRQSLVADCLEVNKVTWFAS